MRIRFHEGPRLPVHDAIDRWWKAFAANADRIGASFKRRAEFALVDFMHEHLGAVDRRIMWEFGPGQRGAEHRLIFTPEREHHLRPLTDAILAAAPEVPGFEFHFGRIAEPGDWVGATVEGRTGHTIDGWQVAITPTPAFGLSFKVIPRPEQLTEERIVGAAGIALESLLGEPFLDPWYDDIEISSREPGAVPFSEGAKLAQAIVETIRSTQVPQRPLFQFDDEEARWSVFELSPEDGDEFPGRSDLITGLTMYVPMWEAAHTRRFFSERFSKFGETFCYLKLDGKDGLHEGFADRGEIEDAVDAALGEAGLGGVIGGGTGRRYSYVDLALLDVERSVPVLREVLQRGNIMKRSWLLFFDDELGAEWVGMWPDSPEPPGLPE